MDTQQKFIKKVVVVTDTFVQIPWMLQSLGQKIVSDIASQSLQDIRILIDAMCFNMSTRHITVIPKL
jgi:hypothetical protein